MLRTKTDYQIKVNPQKPGDLAAQSLTFKNAYLARGGKYLSFNTLTGKFTVDATQEPIVVKTVIATLIQAVIGKRTSYNDSKNTSTTDVNWNNVIDKPKPVVTPRPIQNPVLPENTNLPTNDPTKKEDSSMVGWLILAAGIAAYVASL
jgi:hypothetical protein